MNYLLSIFDGLQPPRQVELTGYGGRQISFGRSSDNDLVLTSPVVSRHHGVLMLMEGGIRVDARGSTNGLLYQGVTVEQCTLQEGDLLRIDDGICNVREGVLILVQSPQGGGSWQQMCASLKRLYDLPGDYTVLSGHTGSTTLERERKTNMFMQSALS